MREKVVVHTGHRVKIEKKKRGVVYTRETPFIEYLKDLRRIDACAPALVWCEQQHKDNPKASFGEVIDALNGTPGHEQNDWARGILQMYDGQFNEGVRKSLLKKIGNDPMCAWRLWMTLSSTTEEEDNHLESLFKGKLPEVEKKLKDFEVKRAKKKGRF